MSKQGAALRQAQGPGRAPRPRRGPSRRHRRRESAVGVGRPPVRKAEPEPPHPPRCRHPVRTRVVAGAPTRPLPRARPTPRGIHALILRPGTTRGEGHVPSGSAPSAQGARRAACTPGSLRRRRPRTTACAHDGPCARTVRIWTGVRFPARLTGCATLECHRRGVPRSGRALPAREVRVWAARPLAIDQDSRGRALSTLSRMSP